MALEQMTEKEALRKQIDANGGDMLRHLIRETVHELMEAEVDAECGAQHRERSEGRTNFRNGVRRRDWDTRAGNIELEIPKLRQGTYYPSWLLEPRRRAERALHQVVAQCYVSGVSTRRVGLLATMSHPYDAQFADTRSTSTPIDGRYGCSLRFCPARQSRSRASI